VSRVRARRLNVQRTDSFLVHAGVQGKSCQSVTEHLGCGQQMRYRACLAGGARLSERCLLVCVVKVQGRARSRQGRGC